MPGLRKEFKDAQLLELSNNAHETFSDKFKPTDCPKCGENNGLEAQKCNGLERNYMNLVKNADMNRKLKYAPMDWRTNLALKEALKALDGYDRDNAFYGITKEIAQRRLREALSVDGCNCKSYNKPEQTGNIEAVELVYPFEEGKIICIDACIADDIAKIWDAGIPTLNCCCGHNVEFPSIVVDDSEVEKLFHFITENIDKYCRWDIYSWKLTKYTPTIA